MAVCTAFHGAITRSPGCGPKRVSKAFRTPHRVAARLQKCSRICSSAHVDVTATTSSQPGLIFGLGQPGAWDEAGVGHPIVRYYLGDNEQRWQMWYSGRSNNCHDIDDLFPSSGSMGIAVSSDGVTWSRGSGPIAGARGEARSRDVGRTLTPNEDWWWHDTCHIHVSDVQILSNNSVDGGIGVYWCFYSGGNYEKTELPPGLFPDQSQESEPREGVTLRPGLAMSQDGRNFARIEADHHTGALFDVGKEGEWDHLFIGSPQVVMAGPRDMRMYYHSYDIEQQKYTVGVATSADGFKWTKRGPIFSGGSKTKYTDHDARGAAGRCIVRDIDTKKYFMFYEAVGSDYKRTIGLAVSDDGITEWKRHPLPVLSPSEENGAWDSGCVGTPWAVSMAQGKWRLYYSGRSTRGSGPWEGIGLALSCDGQVTAEGAPASFKRRSPAIDNE